MEPLIKRSRSWPQASMASARRVILVASLAGVIAAIVLIWLGTGFAACGAANCFLNTGTQNNPSGQGLFTADLSYRYVLMDRGQRGTQKIDNVFTPKVNFEEGIIEPDHHREVKTINNLAQVNLMYGVTQDFGVQLVVPFFNQRTHEHFDGVSAANPAGTFNRADGTDGFGDIQLRGTYNLLVTTKHLLVGGGGVKMPTGEYTLRDSNGGINEPTLMPGTGAWDGIFSGFYQYQIFPHQLDAFLSASYQLRTENSREYKFGDITLLSAGTSYQIFPYLNLSGQINARIQPHDRFLGGKVDGTGGEWVNLTPGIRLQPTPTTQLYAFGQIPIFQRVNESSLVPSFGLLFGISKTFGLSN